MQSNNPVFRRSEEFNSANTYGNQTYAGGGAPTAGYGLPTTPDSRVGAPMTIDSVVQKTAISLAIVIVVAAATWLVTPDLTDSEASLGPLYSALLIGSLGAFALSMVNSFKRVVSPALVLLFAAFEGVALGAFSKVIDSVYGGQDNLVVQAVIGTFAAFAGTLAAYKIFDIKVGSKFRMFVIAAVFGMIGLSLMELVLSMFSSQLGLFGFGGLGMLTAIAGLVLGVFMLILDFDFVEQGIRNQIPEQESWRAAFAITVSLVWIYTNLLRLLAIFNSD
ncbi:Bax inhibitor-1/YccA family protein [Nocardioides sp.]|uniref:Bax inhibitor-1/YccA family protein n=1 Tax=Nocardioides sp. TaxID=35761 RepID=UPI001A2CBFBE|nr:Bax inhibitor-1/YccA family protein [Nocardioides sp.]MBJ7359017.1 Bax inhibitor-1/YccA family protein [Nocardioides sp.]